MNKHWAHRVNVNKEAGLAHGFRSGLEAENARVIEAAGHPVVFEQLKVPYLVPEKGHKYTPDFRLPNGILVETKGLFANNDRAKHLLVKAQYPGLDIRLVFSSPGARLYKGSPTTYALWAESHGFLWAKKVIPLGWLLEPGPTRSPEDVIKAGPAFKVEM